MRESKKSSKARIVQYIMNHRSASKTELSRELQMSMPTLLSNVNELLEDKVLTEVGAYESTGGRKAKKIGINKDYRSSIGVNITQNHVEILLLNLQYEVRTSERTRLEFSPTPDYYKTLTERIKDFVHRAGDEDRILGVGIAIPGIIDYDNKRILKSHILHLDNYSLSFLEQMIPFPLYFENDANAAMMSEDLQKYRNALYISLNRTLGGAFCMDGKLYRGGQQKAGEFGHMILHPRGKTCYCGKKGCADAYCSASALTDGKMENLDEFMHKLNAGDEDCIAKWKKYLDDLAILISNLRMACDMDIILGGDVGGWLQNYRMVLGEQVQRYNGFDLNNEYLKNCVYKREASAVGVARYFLDEFAGRL